MHKRKKIAIVNVFYGPHAIGGATRVVIDNVEALTKHYQDQIEVTVFTSNPDLADEYSLDAYVYRGVRVYSAQLTHTDQFEWQHENPIVGDLYTKFLQFEQPDLVHFHCIQRLTASMLESAKKLNIPYLVTVHDAWWISDYQFLVDQSGNVFPNGHADSLSVPTPPEGVTESQSLHRRMRLKSLLQSASHLLAVSDNFTEIYRNSGLEHCVTNKNGVSSQVTWKPKETLSTNKVVFAHLGGMETHKGFDLVKSVFSTFSPEIFTLLIIDHSKEPNYKQQTKWGGTDVTIIGRQSQSSMPSIYASVDVVLAPSIWPESFGLVTREAMACGCWVVASDIGGIGEDINEGFNGHRVAAGSEEDLLKVLNVIAGNLKKYKSHSTTNSLRTSDEQVHELVQRHYLL